MRARACGRARPTQIAWPLISIGAMGHAIFIMPTAFAMRSGIKKTVCITALLSAVRISLKLALRLLCAREKTGCDHFSFVKCCRYSFLCMYIDTQ